MITVTTQDELRLPHALTARFVGAEHRADVSFFCIHASPTMVQEFLSET